MQLTDFFIRRSTTTTLMIAAIAGFGCLCYFSLPVSNLPEVEYPTIRVNAGLPGANPDVMASTVATPLESEFSMIPGIANMTSSSQTGETNIILQFDLNRSIDAAAQDVQASIARAAGVLPASMPSPPSYSKVNPAADPILWLEMSSTTMALSDFAKYADQVFAKRIAMVSGVSQVPVWGALAASDSRAGRSGEARGVWPGPRADSHRPRQQQRQPSLGHAVRRCARLFAAG